MGSQKDVEKLFVSFGKPKSTCFSHRMGISFAPVESEKFCIIPGDGRKFGSCTKTKREKQSKVGSLPGGFPRKTSDKSGCTKICSVAIFSEKCHGECGLKWTRWQVAQQNPVFHNFASSTATTPATFFIYTILYSFLTLFL